MNTLDVLNLLSDCYHQIIAPRFRDLADDQVKEKAPGDLVTVADQESEKFIAERLRLAFPDALIVGEESYDEDVAVQFANASHAFTIDPIDGTRNFVEGSFDFAVMVAEIKQSQVQRSWILQPQYDRGYIAEAGAGAWVVAYPQLSEGGKVQAKASSLAPIERQPVATDPLQWRGLTSMEWLRGHNLGQLPRLEPGAFSCGIDYPALATGTADFAVYSKEWPWDHAPGLLLLEETGGTVVRPDGRRYQVEVRRSGPLYAVADAELVPAVVSDITPAFTRDPTQMS